MKVFVTGATGVVGRPAVRALIAAGHDVTAVARTPEKAAAVERAGARPVTVDLFDADALVPATAGHDAVVHLATHIPPLSRAARAGAWAVNDRLRTETSAHLIAAARAHGIDRYVQESITYPYLDGGADWLDEDSPIEHDGAFVGAGNAEANVARFNEAGGRGVVLRFAQFYGPTSGHTRTYSRLARLGLNPFTGDPDGYVALIHADDAASAVAAALEAPARTYNVAADDPPTRRAAGEAVARAVGARRSRQVPEWARRSLLRSASALMRSQRVSNARFRAASTWTPRHVDLASSWPTGGEGDEGEAGP